jgi:hypothetical protein
VTVGIPAVPSTPLGLALGSPRALLIEADDSEAARRTAAVIVGALVELQKPDD